MNFDDIKEEAERFVEKNRFLDHFILPEYKLLNICNIQSIVGRLFSAKNLMKSRFADEWIGETKGIEKVVLFIVDGLGYYRLISFMEKHMGIFREMAEKNVLRALSSTFPSTTSTALTSIFTGLTPSEHSVIGYNMYVPHYGVIFNTLSMNLAYGHIGGIDLAEDFSKISSPWLPLLKNEGCEVKTFTRRNLVRSGLSNVIHRHQEIISYNLSTDLMVQLRRALKRPGRLFACVYYPGVDTLEHGYGPYSEEASAEIESFENIVKNQLIDRLPDETKRETLMLVTSDHGVVQTMRTYFLDTPGINDSFLIPPTGDMRATYLFPKYEQEEKLREALTEKLEGMSVLQSTILIDNEAFGPAKTSNLLKTAVGKLSVVSQHKNIILYPYHTGNRSQRVQGAHGGMTPEEMLVPLLSAKMSAL